MTTPDDTPLRRVRPDEDLSSVFGTHQPSPQPVEPRADAAAADPGDAHSHPADAESASAPRPLAGVGGDRPAEADLDAEGAPERAAHEAPAVAGPPTNPVGRWSFIVSIVAAVIALIPMPNFSIGLSFAPAVVAVVLGIAGLCLRGRPWGFAVLGILIAVVSVAASVVLTYAYLGGFDTEAAGVRPGI